MSFPNSLALKDLRHACSIRARGVAAPLKPLEVILRLSASDASHAVPLPRRSAIPRVRGRSAHQSTPGTEDAVFELTFARDEVRIRGARLGK